MDDTKKEDDKRFMLIGHVCSTILALIWLSSIHPLMQQMWKQNARCDFASFGSGVCVNLVAMIILCVLPPDRLGPALKKLVFCVFVLQFPCYMTVIASIYPRSCTFDYFTNGTRYHGGEVKQLSEWNGTSFVGREFNVECDMKLCFSYGLGSDQVICTDGAREFFATLCHLSPLVFLFTINIAKVKGEGGSKFEPAIFANMVDIQDFFLLLLDDELIKNFWGRDRCDDTTFHCSGNSDNTWTGILVFFWLASFSTIFSLYCSAMWDTEHRGCHLRVPPAIFNLVFCEIPFLCYRLWCSFEYSIVASSLLIKNCFGIFHWIAVIYVHWCKPKPKDFPFLCLILKNIDEQIYGEAVLCDDTCGSRRECVQNSTGETDKKSGETDDEAKDPMLFKREPSMYP